MFSSKIPQGRCTIMRDDRKNVVLNYFMTRSSFPFIYGIRVESYLSGDKNHVFSEEVLNLSHDYSEVLHIISLCIRYKVTPSDLFSALDFLMDHDL